jgi:hypothetical protein
VDTLLEFEKFQALRSTVNSLRFAGIEATTGQDGATGPQGLQGVQGVRGVLQSRYESDSVGKRRQQWCAGRTAVMVLQESSTNGMNGSDGATGKTERMPTMRWSSMQSETKMQVVERTKVQCVSTDSDADDFILRGCNVHVENGLGSTLSGNLKR